MTYEIFKRLTSSFKSEDIVGFRLNQDLAKKLYILDLLFKAKDGMIDVVSFELEDLDRVIPANRTLN